MGNIQLNFPTFNWLGKDKFLEWRCFCSEVEKIFIGPYAANGWIHCDNPETVNSWETATRDTTKERLKNLCAAVEQIVKPDASTPLSRYQFRELSHENGHTVYQ